ncbi:hypothetical protein KDA82_30865, partial [Streptomyces daliensis]|nr:hypothetical protein [Streptomyces daliensis]
MGAVAVSVRARRTPRPPFTAPGGLPGRLPGGYLGVPVPGSGRGLWEVTAAGRGGRLGGSLRIRTTSSARRRRGHRRALTFLSDVSVRRPGVP